jgi:Uma2 family endonuclease
VKRMTTAQRNAYLPFGINPETGVEEELAQDTLHSAQVRYLLSVLNQYYRSRKLPVGVLFDLPLHNGDIRNSISPDISVIDGISLDPVKPNIIEIYGVGIDGPVPRLALEITNPHTWDLDIDPEEKPARYAAMGIPYFVAYDPYEPTIWRDEWADKGRLIVWKLIGRPGNTRNCPK